MKYQEDFKKTLIVFFIHHHSLKVVEHYMSKIRDKFFKTRSIFDFMSANARDSIWPFNFGAMTAFFIIERGLIGPGRVFSNQFHRAVISQKI